MNDKPKPCMHGRRFCLECHCDVDPSKIDRTQRCTAPCCTIPTSIFHAHPDEETEAMLDSDARGTVIRKAIPETGAADVYIIPPNAPIHGGRKLRDALLMAGHKIYEESENYILASAPAPRRTLAQSVGRLMAWMLGVPALALAALAVGEYFGWWI